MNKKIQTSINSHAQEDSEFKCIYHSFDGLPRKIILQKQKKSESILQYVKVITIGSFKYCNYVVANFPFANLPHKISHGLEVV